MNDDYNRFYKSLLYLHFSDTTRLKHWLIEDLLIEDLLIDAAYAPT